MPKVYASSVIAAPIERVWAHVRDFNGLPKWFPGVTDSRLEDGVPGDQAGCVRNFGLATGGRMREQLLEFSDKDYVCGYKMLEGAVPMSRYQAGLRLRPITDAGTTFAEMTADFDCPAGMEDAVTGFLAQTYAGAFAAIKKQIAGA